MEFTIVNNDSNAVVHQTTREENGIHYVDVEVTYKEALSPKRMDVKFAFDYVDCFGITSASGKHQILPDGGNKIYARLASGMPLQLFHSQSGKNRASIAVSDAAIPIEFHSGVSEETARVECTVAFFTELTTPRKTYSATVRVDTRDIPYYESIYDVASWWENECGYTPAFVPDAAKMPMDSLWYSFHQMLSVEEIINECKLSKEMGMETVIIDDGWQTDDNNRGYAYCGDWELAESKVGDMKTMVDEIHKIGMKVMLWFSVPFVGEKSKIFDRFKGMYLYHDSRLGTAVLDPRYKEVRDYLTTVYCDAVKNWGLDGLKLDFIDSFKLSEDSVKPDEKRDFVSLEDGLDALMLGVKERLTAIKPDVLIEFRQSYVGPKIKQYGNMLRVVDCPCAAMTNRIGVIDLRLTSGKTAVHSDMTMWNLDDTVESAASQITAVLYGVPQISVRIDKLNDAHKKMLKFYLGFWREYRDILLDGEFKAYNPEVNYSQACASNETTEIVTAYSNPIITITKKTCIAVNATGASSLILKGGAGKAFTVLNCMGEKIAEGVLEHSLEEICVPNSGMIILK